LRRKKGRGEEETEKAKDRGANTLENEICLLWPDNITSTRAVVKPDRATLVLQVNVGLHPSFAADTYIS